MLNGTWKSKMEIPAEGKRWRKKYVPQPLSGLEVLPKNDQMGETCSTLVLVAFKGLR
jgi:hypothetical protein